MKTNKWFVALLCLTLLAVAGCKKEYTPPEFVEVNGVRVDLPQLEQAFANATPEQRTLVSDIQAGVRYSDPVKAMMGLDTLSNDAGLNDAQKAIVTKVLEQMKQVAAKGPAQAPAQ